MNGYNSCYLQFILNLTIYFTIVYNDRNNRYSSPIYYISAINVCDPDAELLFKLFSILSTSSLALTVVVNLKLELLFKWLSNFFFIIIINSVLFILVRKLFSTYLLLIVPYYEFLSIK